MLLDYIGSGIDAGSFRFAIPCYTLLMTAVHGCSTLSVVVVLVSRKVNFLTSYQPCCVCMLVKVLVTVIYPWEGNHLPLSFEVLVAVAAVAA